MVTKFKGRDLLDSLLAAAGDEQIFRSDPDMIPSSSPYTFLPGELPDMKQMRTMLHLSLYERQINGVCDELVEFVLNYIWEAMGKLMQSAVEMQIPVSAASSSIDDYAFRSRYENSEKACRNRSALREVPISLEDVFYAVKTAPELLKGDSVMMETLLAMMRHCKAGKGCSKSAH